MNVIAFGKDDVLAASNYKNLFLLEPKSPAKVLRNIDVDEISALKWFKKN